MVNVGLVNKLEPRLPVLTIINDCSKIENTYQMQNGILVTEL